MADDVEGQLPRLGAQQLGLQEGGPLLLQQLVPAHVVLGPRGRSQSRLDPPRRPAPVPLPLGRGSSAPPPPPPQWLPRRPAPAPPPPGPQTLQTLATRDVWSFSKNSNSLAVSSKKKYTKCVEGMAATKEASAAGRGGEA